MDYNPSGLFAHVILYATILEWAAVSSTKYICVCVYIYIGSIYSIYRLSIYIDIQYNKKE